MAESTIGMKNQYFGDVNDYRKYGLLRALSANGGLRIGVCWMLTPKDKRPDGRKTEYLHRANGKVWQHFDPELYDFLQSTVNGHELDQACRDVAHFDQKLLADAVFWKNVLTDNEIERREYFRNMWEQFRRERVNLIFFDPDNGLANNRRSTTRKKKGHKESRKFLFRDELFESVRQGMSVLVYQHFNRTERTCFIQRLVDDLMQLVDADRAFSFVTPHVVFFLIPHSGHQEMLSGAARVVNDSPWSAENSCSTSATTKRRQILVQSHEPK